MVPAVLLNVRYDYRWQVSSCKLLNVNEYFYLLIIHMKLMYAIKFMKSYVSRFVCICVVVSVSVCVRSCFLKLTISLGLIFGIKY